MKRPTKGRASKYKLYGGPWDGEFIMLRGSTMVFSVGTFNGKYIVDAGIARWQNVL